MAGKGNESVIEWCAFSLPVVYHTFLAVARHPSDSLPSRSVVGWQWAELSPFVPEVRQVRTKVYPCLALPKKRTEKRKVKSDFFSKRVFSLAFLNHCGQKTFSLVKKRVCLSCLSVQCMVNEKRPITRFGKKWRKNVSEKRPRKPKRI